MQKNVEKMTINYSPNFNPKKRNKKKIKYLIYHYTGMKSDRLAIKKLTSSNSNVSCHYYITSNGKLIQMVPDLYIAWHAGKSTFENISNCNDYSIGIELEGFDDIVYEDIQYEKLSKIIKALLDFYPRISTDRIVGHSDVSPQRKSDPGPLFDWKRLKSML